MKAGKSSGARTSQLSIIFKMFPYLWGHSWTVRLPILLSFFFICSTIALNISIPLILRKIISALGNQTSIPYYGALTLLIAYGVMWTLSQITTQLRQLVIFRTIERAITLVMIDFFEHVHRLSLRFHVGKKTGALTNALDRAQKAIPHIFVGFFLYMIPTIIEIFFVMAVLWYLYSFVWGFSLLIILVVYILFSTFAMEWSAKVQRISNIKESQAGARLVDSLLNYETVKYFNNEEYERRQSAELLKEREDAATKKETISELIYLGQGVLIGIGLTLMTWVSGKAVLEGRMQVSDFVLINGYLLQFVTPLSYFGYILRQMRRGLTDMEHIFDIIAQEPEVVDIPDAHPLHILKGEIVFDHVTFGYDPRRLILKGISFTVKPGTTTAIVGSSGAGKSTIARLLFRFYDVTSGRILIDGQDIRSVMQSSLRAAIGIVPQDTVLFNNTLYYNIAYGRPQASKEQVERAIKLSHLDTFINHLPEGYNAMVGERGLKLSGGEKQRVAIARVLLKEPVIYVFDEATSALDTNTEREIQRNLEEISTGSTTLIIAHRLSTVIHADQIIVLDHGNVVERGTHEELLHRKGVYAFLWQKQIQHQGQENE